MPSTATAGRTSFLSYCCNQAAARNAMSAGNPLFQAFSPIPVWGSTDSDCIKVGVKIDAPCGAGKTSWAIQYMNENEGESFIYCTPFLDEIARIREHCGVERFNEPQPYDFGTKIEDFNNLYIMDFC